MPKGVQRSNKEPKKQKQPKKLVVPGVSSAAPGKPAAPPPGKKK
jgi:hypothetical protein